MPYGDAAVHSALFRHTAGLIIVLPGKIAAGGEWTSLSVPTLTRKLSSPNKEAGGSIGAPVGWNICSSASLGRTVYHPIRCITISAARRPASNSSGQVRRRTPAQVA